MKQGWEIKKLGEVCEFVRGPFGGSLTKDCFKESGYPVYEQQNAIYSKFNFRYFIDEKKFNEMRRFTVNAGDLIMSCSGTLGKVAIVPDDAPIGIINQALLKLSIKSEHLDLNYLYKYMESPMFFDLITNGAQGAAIKNVASVQTLKALDIPIPSITEQERIVGILDSAFAKIEALRANAQQNLQNTKDLFQASLKQELTPKQGWESKRLNEICEVKDGTHDSPKYVDDGIPFVTQKNITAKGFDIQDTRKIALSDHEKFYKRSNVEYGDILISMIGANRGMSCVVDVRDTFSIKNVGLVKQSDTIKQRYLLYYLQSPISAKYVADASNGGAQEFIGLTALRAFPILFPKNSEEQQSIVEKLDALSECCRAMEENYRQTITHCNALKQALLTKAFNGEL